MTNIKSSILFLVLFICALSAISQPISGKVIYDFKIAHTLLEGELIFTSNAQKFIYYRSDEKKDLNKKRKKNNLRFDQVKRDSIGHVVYSNWSTDSYKTRQIGRTIHIVTDSVLNHEWVITPEKKEVLGFTCQKATLDFRGRSYEVWFASNFPFIAGPWKFHGLPGLILEVVDDTGEVGFYAREVVFPAKIDVHSIEEFEYEGKPILWLDYHIKNINSTRKFINYAVSKMYDDGEDNSDLEVEVKTTRFEIIPPEIIDEYNKKKE